MRIAYLALSPLPSGIASSVHVAKMCQAMGRLGHDVSLFVPARPEVRWDVDDAYAFYGVERTFAIERMPWPAVRGRLYFSAAATVRATKRFAPDLVYGRFLEATYAAAMVGLPVVFESHLPVPPSPRLRHWTHTRLLAHRRLVRLVLISHALKREYLSQYHAKEEQVVVVHDAADDPGARAAMKLGDALRLQVGYVGNLYPGKGVEVVVELARLCPWADFHVIGGDPSQVEGWQPTVASLPNLAFHGFVPHGLTDRYRLGCDVLLAPYQSRVFGHGGGEISRWMSPLKIFEYMAAGRAIVASDLPVLREVLEDGRNAVLCDPDSPARWANALKELAKRPDLRRRLGSTARAQFVEHHTWTARARAVLDGLTTTPGKMPPRRTRTA